MCWTPGAQRHLITLKYPHKHSKSVTQTLSPAELNTRIQVKYGRSVEKIETVQMLELSFKKSDTSSKWVKERS